MHLNSRSFPSEPSDSDSESESDSRSDESNDDEGPSVKLDVQDHDVDDDEEVGPVLTTGTYFQTKHEVLESDIIIPDLEEVGPEEVLEKVGEIMGIIDKLVIIKGVPSEVPNRGSERALDSDTLLVFEDRKVMGYVSASPYVLILRFYHISIHRFMKLLARLHNLYTK